MSKYDESEKPTHSMEACKTLAEQLGFTANGVRLVLTQAGVYIAKTPRSSAATSTADKPKAATRGSKQVSLNNLKTAIRNIDPELLDEELIDKLTGVQAEYFATIISKVV